jgi:hypothetical protein
MYLRKYQSLLINNLLLNIQPGFKGYFYPDHFTGFSEKT